MTSHDFLYNLLCSSLNMFGHYLVFFQQIYGMNEDGNSSAPGKSIKEQTRLHTEESDLNNNFKQTKKHMTRFTDDSD